MSNVLGTATLELVTDATQANKGIDDVEQKVKGLADEFESAGKRADDGLSKAGKAADDAGTKASGLGSSIKGVGTIASGFVVGSALTKLPELMGDAIGAASDLNESMSKVDVVFGSNAKEIHQWSQGSAQAMGISRQAAEEAAGTFGNLFVSIGLGQKPATDLSKNIVGLASDLASFNNLSPEDTLEKLRAGLVGEAEPLRSLGVNMNEAMVKAKGMELGLADANGELSEGAKVQARYAIIMDQTKTAQGDFARTSDGLANSQRIQAAETANAAAAMGSQLSPIMAALSQLMSSTLIPALTLGLLPAINGVITGIKFLADNGGIVLPVLAGIGAGVTAVALVLLVQFMPAISSAIGGALAFTAALLTNPLVLFGLAIAALVVGIIFLVKYWDEITAKIPALGAAFDAVMAVIGAVVGFITGTVVPAIKGAFDAIVAAGGALVGFITENWSTIQAVISGAIATVTSIVSAGFNEIKAVIQFAIGVITGIIDIFVGVFTGDWGRAKDGALGVIYAFRDLAVNTFKNLLDLITGLPIASKLFEWASEGMRLFLDAVSSGAYEVLNFFTQLPGRIVGALGDLGSILFDAGKRLLTGFVDGIKSMVGSVVDAVTGAVGSAVNKIPGAGAVKGLFGGATGGTITGGGAMIVGERGPELAMLPRGARLYPADQTATILRNAGTFGVPSMSGATAGGTSNRMNASINVTINGNADGPTVKRALFDAMDEWAERQWGKGAVAWGAA